MRSRTPAKFEFDLLQFLSRSNGLSVREIHEQFGVQHGYIRGTIVKAMDRLLKKTLVTRSQVDGTYVYKTKQATEDLDRQLVESFIKERLGGRLKPLAAFFAEAEGIDPKELQTLKDALKKAP